MRQTAAAKQKPPAPPRPRRKKAIYVKKERRGVTQSDVEFGRRMRLRRVEIGMSQEALAAKLGLSFQQVQKYEKGVNRIGASRLKDIAMELDVPVEFFFATSEDEGAREVESLLFLDSVYCLRLLRAYHAVGSELVQHSFVELLERIAAAPASP